MENLLPITNTLKKQCVRIGRPGPASWENWPCKHGLENPWSGLPGKGLLIHAANRELSRPSGFHQTMKFI